MTGIYFARMSGFDEEGLRMLDEAGGENPAAAARQLADVRDMAIVHQLFRREFALAPQVLRELRPEQTERRGALEEWLELVVVAMHHHHMAEDAWVFPVLEGRIPPHLITVMEQQHEQVAAATDAVQACLGEWRSTDRSPDALVAALEQLLTVLVRHLDDEERDIVPLIEQRMTPAEYGVMATSGNGRFDQHTLLMAFGGMVEQCATEDAAYMISHLPPDYQQVWHDHGHDDYDRLMGLIRGGLKPIPFAAAR